MILLKNSLVLWALAIGHGPLGSHALLPKMNFGHKRQEPNPPPDISNELQMTTAIRGDQVVTYNSDIPTLNLTDADFLSTDGWTLNCDTHWFKAPSPHLGVSISAIGKALDRIFHFKIEPVWPPADSGITLAWCGAEENVLIAYSGPNSTNYKLTYQQAVDAVYMFRENLKKEALGACIWNNEPAPRDPRFFGNITRNEGWSIRVGAPDGPDGHYGSCQGWFDKYRRPRLDMGYIEPHLTPEGNMTWYQAVQELPSPQPPQIRATDIEEFDGIRSKIQNGSINAVLHPDMKSPHIRYCDPVSRLIVSNEGDEESPRFEVLRCMELIMQCYVRSPALEYPEDCWWSRANDWRKPGKRVFSWWS